MIIVYSVHVSQIIFQHNPKGLQPKESSGVLQAGIRNKTGFGVSVLVHPFLDGVADGRARNCDPMAECRSSASQLSQDAHNLPREAAAHRVGEGLGHCSFLLII